MQQQTMRQFTLVCCILGLTMFLGSVAVVGLGLLGVTAASLKLAASSIMILTLALQLTFVAAQLSRAGRIAVPVPGFGPDGWVLVLLATGMPGVLWDRLAAYAGAPANLLMPGFVGPIVIMVVLLIGREIQQRMHRHERDQATVA